jgi:hypothetical protein
MSSAFLFSLIGIVLLLGTVPGCLYSENKKYEIQNRNLILQNDSIQSVNIELSTPSN